MVSLSEGLEVLERDLAARPPRIAAHSDMPFAVFVYPPQDEYALRQHLRLLAIRLEADHARRVTFVSCFQGVQTDAITLGSSLAEMLAARLDKVIPVLYPRLEIGVLPLSGEEAEAGVSALDARQALVRGTAFTWLNRIVAIRMLEERRLIKLSVGKLLQSNGFTYWLTSEGNERHLKLRELGEFPLNAAGEGPVHVAYRCYVLSLRPAIWIAVVESMAKRDPVAGWDLFDAWKPGNEETVGWVYESFVSLEKAAVFAAFPRGEKVAPAQIPAATEVFTPRRVVRFLLHNSLGRIWMDVHPDSRLQDSLGYLVPPEPGPAASRLAKEITFLDPCCGSMHFGLVAFDLYAEMYREELDRAGEQGWPAKPSVASADEIPASEVGKVGTAFGCRNSDEAAAGGYDWAAQAMAYWPERVREACRANLPVAIARGLEPAGSDAPAVRVSARRKPSGRKTKDRL